MNSTKREDAQLANLSDDYIRDLEPDNQRYDITLSQDFVISVLPNGIKTWAFIYDFQGRHRRKTLGVFPEMNFSDAKAALEKARASMLRMDEPTVAPSEFGTMPAVLGGSKYVPKVEKAPRNWVPILKILGALAVIAVIAIVAFLLKNTFDSDATQSAPDTPAASAPFTTTKKPTHAANPDSAPARTTPAPAITTPTTVIQPNERAVSSSTSESTQALSSANAPNPTPKPDDTTPLTVSNKQETTRTDAGQFQSQESAPVSTPVTKPQTSVAKPVANSTSSQPNSESTIDAGYSNNRPVTTLAATTKATAFGGRVSRSRLTSRVQDLEPTDTLGPEISYKNSGFTRVFYFTELRDFSDGKIVHRWSLNGETQEEVVLNVKKSWRWRTYSNKDVTPGLNGEWTVETIDATGKILDTESFTYDYQ